MHVVDWWRWRSSSKFARVVTTTRVSTRWFGRYSLPRRHHHTRARTRTTWSYTWKDKNKHADCVQKQRGDENAAPLTLQRQHTSQTHVRDCVFARSIEPYGLFADTSLPALSPRTLVAYAQCAAPRRYTLSYHLYPLQQRDSSTTDRTDATLATTRAQWRGHVRADVLWNRRDIGLDCAQFPGNTMIFATSTPPYDVSPCTTIMPFKVVKSTYRGRWRMR